ncbi:hypothetical protein [Bacillus sp. PK30]|uniref:hypothetical protein n=1 Tax=Bacillus sp. PK30 TaxID=2954724 RepID=UPI0030FA056C
MEEKQKKNKIVEFGNKISETTKQTFDHLNFLKHFTKLAKKLSNDDKEKAIKIIETIDNMNDDKTKAETLKSFIDSDNRKQIIEKIIYALKYLSGAALIAFVAVHLNQNNQSQERDYQ